MHVLHHVYCVEGMWTCVRRWGCGRVGVWVQADSGNASDDETVNPQEERYAEVWYFNPESTESSVRA